MGIWEGTNFWADGVPHNMVTLLYTSGIAIQFSKGYGVSSFKIVDGDPKKLEMMELSALLHERQTLRGNPLGRRIPQAERLAQTDEDGVWVPSHLADTDNTDLDGAVPDSGNDEDAPVEGEPAPDGAAGTDNGPDTHEVSPC